VSVPHEHTSGAEARFFFLVLIGTTGSRALPGLARGRRCCLCRQQQVPHRASALFGMTTVDLGGFYAALKRRSSTVLAVVVTHQVKIKNKVKGDGQECPSHTGIPQGLKPGSFFLVLIGTTGSRALPGLSQAGFVVGTDKNQQQVPHRAFGPVRNDKVGEGVGLSQRLSAAPPKIKISAAVVEVPSKSTGENSLQRL
jgi:hypothetical protein